MKQKVTFYTVGYESLSQCYPKSNFEWMRYWRGVMQHIPEALRDVHGNNIDRMIDCRDLKTDKTQRPYGHLGFHEANVGMVLGQNDLRRFHLPLTQVRRLEEPATKPMHVIGFVA